MNREELMMRLEGFEWDDFEVKAGRKAAPKSAYETVSAFANTRGGHLVFGVEEKGETLHIVGVLNIDQVQNDFLSALHSRQKVSCQLETPCSLLDDEGRKVMVFYVPEAPREQKPVYLNGDIRRSYIRRLGGDHRCSEDEIRRFLRNASTDRFDRTPIARDLRRCFDDDAIRWYRNRFETRNPSSEANSFDDMGFLEHWGLLTESEGSRVATAASILLFGTGNALRSILARPTADCFNYAREFDSPQEDERWADRVTFEGNLVRTWREILEWYLRQRNVPFRLDPETLERKQRPEDYVSFREASINLLTHQDFEESSKNATIALYSDRIEFRNPGTSFEDREALLLPGDKHVRNPLVVDAFRRIGVGERAGTGLRAIYRDWRRLGRVPPQIENDVAGCEFRLSLLGEGLLSERQLLFQASLGVDLEVDEANVLALLCRARSVSPVEISLATGRPKGEAEQLAQNLVRQVVAVATSTGYRLAPHLRERWPLAGELSSLDTDQADRDSPSLVTEQAPATEKTDLDGQKLRAPLTELDDRQRSVLRACGTPQSQKALMQLLDVTHRGYFRDHYLTPLVEAGLLAFLYPDRPTHPQQRVILTAVGSKLVGSFGARQSRVERASSEEADRKSTKENK